MLQVTRLRSLRPIALLGALVAAILALPAGSAQAAQPDGASSAVVLQWYDLTTQTVAAAALPEQATQDRVWAVSWLAAARAARDGYGSRFQTAAFATALHDALVALVPAQAPTLDAALATTLAGVRGGAQKDRGAAAGSREAAAVLAQRSGDGLDGASIDVPFTPPAAAPGVWQPTPPTFGPAVRAGLGKARSFVLRANDQFRLGPPPALDSQRYLTALAEVHAVGSATSTVRTPAQTDVALFWEQNSIDAFVQVVRGVLLSDHGSLLAQARLVAAFHAILIDAQIAIYDSKYTYLFWRPVTAIRTGTVDPDPAWTPLLNTPRHPEYPSGHTGYAGAAQRALEALVGPRPRTPIAVTSSTDPGAVHTFTTWSAITQENVNGRVWQGVHFRSSDEVSTGLGRQVAGFDLQRLRAIGL